MRFRGDDFHEVWLPGFVRNAVLGAVLVMLSTGSFAQREVLVSGHIQGASGKHAVYVALWDADGFLRNPVQELRIAPGAIPAFTFRVAAGRWAVSAYEDKNDNGKLDMGLFGPKEPAGFGRPFHAWRKPHFEDVAVQVEHDMTDVNIQLHP
ncbi:DUF2141 domain-containing protein [Candidatus Korobacter versatilis]|uniref:DUF2141 domain-containing protein n=1 Tax=Candidatus Korobacter versatilis TaxID=658062 RepID=UPI0006750305|nr:DUF2141 domain-containing protein [Candidatus Koribacter versatilis]